MTLQTYQKLLTQRPFRPFRLVMSSGKTHDVRHPEMAWLTRNDLLVGVGEIDETIPSEWDVCALLHDSAIEPLPRPATSDAPSSTANPPLEVAGRLPTITGPTSAAGPA